MEDYVIVGSKAMSYLGLSHRAQSDLDVWVRECGHVPSFREFRVDCSVIPDNIMDLIENEDGYASMNSLYTIKLSHLGYDIFWQKHKRDSLLMKKRGANIIEPLYEALKEYWKELHGNKDFLSLYKSKEEFFDDHVQYVYDHDWLHSVVSYPEEPIYKSVLKNGHEVLTDKYKFDNLTFDKQVRMFQEEIAVIAIERWLVSPKWKGRILPQVAQQYALEKAVTSLTKGWATDFIVRNLEHFDIFPKDLIYNALQQLKEGELFMTKQNTDKEIFYELKKELDKEFEWSMDELICCLCDNDVEVPVNFGYKHLVQEGGGEGGSGYCFGVFELGGKTYKAEYSYYSYEGYDYDGIFDTIKEVKPVTKTVVVYE